VFRSFPEAGRGAEDDEGIAVFGSAEGVHPEAGSRRHRGGGDLALFGAGVVARKPTTRSHCLAPASTCFSERHRMFVDKKQMQSRTTSSS
jgi:hypothetical protein